MSLRLRPRYRGAEEPANLYNVPIERPEMAIGFFPIWQMGKNPNASREASFWDVIQAKPLAGWSRTGCCRCG